MQMQLTRERSFSSPAISTLMQNAPQKSQDNNSSSRLSDLSPITALKNADALQFPKDKCLSDKTAKQTHQIQNKKTASPKSKTESAISEAKGGKNCRGLRRCSTFPRSKVIHAEEQKEEETVQKGNLHAKGPVSSEQPSYQRSVSVPNSFRIKSALKGSRAQDGISPRSCEMHVRWAPDVYDPPVTSSSHTVQKGRPSSSKGKKKGKKKDNNNSRKKKGKKSERKSTAVESSIDSSGSAIETSADETLICESDVKCGSEFLRDSLSKMHFSSTAEAS